MKLIVGLGNIGPQYAKTRHNAGFMVISELANRFDATWRTEAKFKAEVAEGWLSDGGERVILAKPHTMMNLSGEAVSRLMQFYKLSPNDVWVIFDDVDVPFGRLRLRRGNGSGGGHQGVNSTIQHIGPNFIRAKFGISLNDRSKESSEVYVLKPFNPTEQEQLPTAITQAADILLDQLKRDAAEETTFTLI